MAATSAALKLGSVVKEVAICSTKTCCTLGESTLVFVLLESLLLPLDLVKSRVTSVGVAVLRDAEQGNEARVTLRPEPDVASIWEEAWG